jgi:hypothetical protein
MTRANAPPFLFHIALLFDPPEARANRRRAPDTLTPFHPDAYRKAAQSGAVKDGRRSPPEAARFEQSLEKFLRHTIGKIPEGFACRRGCEGRDVEPVEPVMAMRDRTLADRRPDSARDRLQANAVLVRGEDLDRLAGVLCGLLGNGIRKLFLNAAASSGEADLGFFGRGFWIDQPMAFKASQPRCGATDLSLARRFKHCGLPGEILPAHHCDVDISRMKLDRVAAAAGHFRRYDRGA